MHTSKLPNLRTFCGSDKNFSKALAYLYADIAEFHQRAYTFFRRRGKPFILHRYFTVTRIINQRGTCSSNARDMTT